MKLENETLAGRMCDWCGQDTMAVPHEVENGVLPVDPETMHPWIRLTLVAWLWDSDGKRVLLEGRELDFCSHNCEEAYDSNKKYRVQFKQPFRGAH